MMRTQPFAHLLGLPVRAGNSGKGKAGAPKRPAKARGKSATPAKPTPKARSYAHLLKGAEKRGQAQADTTSTTSTAPSRGRRITPMARAILAAHKRATGQKPRP
ncbi:hypothetical protein [Cupriavidus metallidurans]|uniref:hypothetical protein n=1 Tax=Cupriavidus metallidurans TaxID=119219 RepID=UPI001BFCB427|nr:hypothetical protein [Cupriavidus metallidurans]QWC87783.1 hypothetical protein KB891_12100 [Cupriavidus metallidurans]